MSPSRSKPNAKKKAKAVQKLALTITGDEVRYFVGIPNNCEFRKLREKGLQFESGLMTYCYLFGARTVKSWVSPYSVVATVDDSSVPIYHKEAFEPKRVLDYDVKNVIFAVNTANAIEYTAEVVANSISDVRLEISVTEMWILPDQRQIHIYSLEVVGSSGMILEYQTGGWGYIRGELVTPNMIWST